MRNRLLSLARNDYALAALLGLLGVFTRLPFATRILYSWDSANFAQGMAAFNVARHAPHPPGYLWYVLLARLFNLVLHDPNASLVAISIIFSGLAAAALFALGRTLFDRPTGVGAALLLLTGVTFWAYGAIALSYMTLATFAIAVAGLAAQVILGNPPSRTSAVCLSLVYAVAGGFRPDLLLFLAPLWLLALLRLSWRVRLLNAAIVIGGTLLWLAPTVWLSGGPREYVAVLGAYFGRDVLDRYSATRHGGAALTVNLRDLGLYLGQVFYAQALLLAPAGLWWLRRSGWRDRRWQLVALWVAPALAFYALVHIGDPGYVYAVTPAFCLLGGWFVARALGAARDGVAGAGPVRRFRAAYRPLALAALALVLLTNTGLFLFYDKPLTATGLRRADQARAARIEHIRAHYAPDETALLSYMSYKHTRQYLPGYAQSGWVDLFSRQQGRLELAPGMRYVVLADDELRPLARPPERWEAVEVRPGVRLYRLELHGERELIYGPEGILAR